MEPNIPHSIPTHGASAADAAQARSDTAPESEHPNAARAHSDAAPASGHPGVASAHPDGASADAVSPPIPSPDAAPLDAQPGATPTLTPGNAQAETAPPAHRFSPEAAERVILEAAAELRDTGSLGQKRLAALVRAANRGIADNANHLAKKHLMPHYRAQRDADPGHWRERGIDERLEERLLRALQVKPRRTASGVATIAVITKPWPCANDCLYCPNDLRMPKSYIADEPACQRAERTWFDPYLQVAARLRALMEMGHVTDKVELIILGGSWTDYPQPYQRWFVAELFRALNEAGAPSARESERRRRSRYEQLGIPRDEEGCRRFVAAEQEKLNARTTSYNRAFARLYGENAAWRDCAGWQQACWDEVERQHAANERAEHRVVGLVVETRPDAADAAAFARLRRLGCTKVQMGIQSLDERILAMNRRGGSGGARTEAETARRAFELARLFGFKTHAHFMANLLGATPASDKDGYRRLMADASLAPDEVKLYPCALVAGTDLVRCFEDGSWRPYTEDELMDVLASDLLETPPYTRVSRMIRDIPAQDILVGNKKINLRQMVEAEADRRAKELGRPIREIRRREIGVAGAEGEDLALDEVRYATSVSDEAFLQWVTPEGRIAGFLRLSLPKPEAVAAAREAAEREARAEPDEQRAECEKEKAEREARDSALVAAQDVERGERNAAAQDTARDEKRSAAENAAGIETARENPEREASRGAVPAPAFPIEPGEAMIREVHVYGSVASLHRTSGGAQHRGLGRALVERACSLAREQGFHAINVISAVGTRAYYRSLGFSDNGLYQQRRL